MVLVIDVKLKDKETKIIEYRNIVDVSDYKKIAILLKDIEMAGVPVRKAYDSFND